MRKKFFLKGIVEFGILFLLILTALYCWTALFGNTLPQKNQNTEKRMVTDKARLTTPKVERIKPQGFARYIGTSDDTILNSFGEPQEKLPSATNVEWWFIGKVKNNISK
ncbi:hypothetical protein JCM15457_208 [Liquorilactobacillus sucicola DSM 21376 = JCM 15457]|uniref:hypothetical protein n=1 Tax=Liquorilactobacillus sucicola TaxID=519050 RepID=UPI00043313C9|nr:hypothetical protein [Liquorilactobacillus sucicola]GAJ25348.1 hypothetical protein JCM15457_208 [Liquorilactobacillus sucicola DSM 21376 = JCM 15457]